MCTKLSSNLSVGKFYRQGLLMYPLPGPISKSDSASLGGVRESPFLIISQVMMIVHLRKLLIKNYWLGWLSRDLGIHGWLEMVPENSVHAREALYSKLCSLAREGSSPSLWCTACHVVLRCRILLMLAQGDKGMALMNNFFPSWKSQEFVGPDIIHSLYRAEDNNKCLLESPKALFFSR